MKLEIFNFIDKTMEILEENADKIDTVALN